MAKVTQYPHGTFSWIDAQSTDPARDKAFYQAALGWEYDDLPIGEGMVYTMFKKKGENVAGLGEMQPDMKAAGVPSNWTAYVAVDDVDAVTAKVEGLGGTVVAPVMDVFDNGRMSIITDPSGATLGLWQAKNHIGASLVNEDGALVWNELNTREPDKAMKFFGDLFGWTFDKMEMDNADYWVIQNNGRMNGGMMQMTAEWEGMPPHWMNYLHVDDGAGTAEKIKSNGGNVAFGPIDSDVGKMYVVSAPSGAHFSIIQSSSVDAWVE
jgi:uncharacterized protein